MSLMEMDWKVVPHYDLIQIYLCDWWNDLNCGFRKLASYYEAFKACGIVWIFTYHLR